MASNRNLMRRLFLESPEDELTEAEKEVVVTEKEPLAGPEVTEKKLEARRKELAGILKKMGIENADKRLVVDCNMIHLTCENVAQHKVDAAILLDLTKIDPICDANFAVIDSEVGRPDEPCFIDFISIDQSVPDVELDKVTECLEEDLQRRLNPDHDREVEELLNKILGK